MARLDTIGFNELAPTLRALADAGATVEDADILRSPGNAEKFVAFMKTLRVEKGLRALRSVYEKPLRNPRF